MLAMVNANRSRVIALNSYISLAYNPFKVTYDIYIYIYIYIFNYIYIKYIYYIYYIYIVYICIYIYMYMYHTYIRRPQTAAGGARQRTKAWHSCGRSNIIRASLPWGKM